MSSEFMNQFMGGWQMGMQRLRNQQMQEQEAYQRQQDAIRQQKEEQAFQLQRERMMLDKKNLENSIKEQEWAWKAKQAAMTPKEQEIAPPEVQDLGGGGPDDQVGKLFLGAATQPSAPIMAEVPYSGGQMMQMPFREEAQQMQVEDDITSGKVIQVPDDPSIPEAFRGRIMPNNAATAALLSKWVEGPKLERIDTGDAIRFVDPRSINPGDVFQKRPGPRQPEAPPAPGEMTSGQNRNYMAITTKFQGDKIMEAAGNAAQARTLADEALKNPGSATNQLMTLYLLVKNLDPTSAVREGELGLAQSIQTYWDKYETQWARLNTQRIISPQAAKELAEATKKVVGLWEKRGAERIKQYQAQAAGAGVKDAFDSYLSNSGLMAPTGKPGPTGGAGPTGIDPDVEAALREIGY